jgi:2-polyprenyl-6-methoxyphenol hydroxylase-like FAD-dependent oxidoreductase
MEQASNTGISILVAGGGIAGLSFAIEAHRKGHNVKIIERRPPGESTGMYEAWHEPNIEHPPPEGCRVCTCNPN